MAADKQTEGIGLQSTPHTHTGPGIERHPGCGSICEKKMLSSVPDGSVAQSSHRTFKLGVHFFSLHRNSNFLKRSDHSCCRSAEEKRPIFCWRGSIAISVHDVKIGDRIK